MQWAVAAPASKWTLRHGTPAGTYMVTGYRRVAMSDEGIVWIWSTTSPSYRKLEVKAGGTTHLDVRRKLKVNARAFEKKGKHRVALVFQSERRLGNTLYRDGTRIDIVWQCLDERGAVLSKGTMRYG